MNAIIKAVKETCFNGWIIAIYFGSVGVLPAAVYVGLAVTLCMPAAARNDNLATLGSFLCFCLAAVQVKSIGGIYFNKTFAESSTIGVQEGLWFLVRLAGLDSIAFILGSALVNGGLALAPSWLTTWGWFRLLLFVMSWVVILVGYAATEKILSEDKVKETFERVIRGRSKLKGPEEAQRIADQKRKRRGADAQLRSSSWTRPGFQKEVTYDGE